MKTRLVKLIMIILASLFFTACKQQGTIEPYIGKYTDLMADTYCNYKCDYPKTLGELISYMQSIRDEWMEFPSRDTIQVVLSFLENGRNDITWIYCHPTLASLTIGAIYKDDTLFYKTREWYFPYLYDKIYYYIKYHLDYPKSLDDLLRYDSIGYNQPNFWEPKCWEVTRNYLWDNRDKLEWIVDEDFLLIKADQDTIICDIDEISRVRCYKVPLEIHTMVFVDTQESYNYNEEIGKSFKAGMKYVIEDFLNNNEYIKYGTYMVEYRCGVGLNRLCESDDFSLDTKWFKEMEKYVSQFAQEHELERILFYTPAFEVK